MAIPLWGWLQFPFWALVVLAAFFGMLQFTLYPLATAFANDNVEPERRVGLSAVVYIVYGMGACVGPFVAGFLMRRFESGVYFMFVSACATAIVLFVRQRKVKGDHVSDDAPTHFVPMYDSLQTSNVAAVLDPRVDAETDVSHEMPDESDLPGHQPDGEPDDAGTRQGGDGAGGDASSDGARS